MPHPIRILVPLILLLLAGAALARAPERQCRGEGVTEVKAADEHCGFVARERKLAALEAACRLAEDVEAELRRTAEEEARSACPDRSGERCEVTFRRWENVYTHALSGKCWTSCGWAAVVSCREEDEAEG